MSTPTAGIPAELPATTIPIEDVAPILSVLIVAYRTREELGVLLPTIAGAAGAVTYEVVIVDNASEDGTAQWLADEWPDVSVVPLETNIGFARGVNLAATHARGQSLLLLNPDTVARAGAFQRLVEHASRHPFAGLIGGRTLTEDGETEPSCCWGKPTMWSTFCFATGLSTAFRNHRLFDPEALGGWDRTTSREVGVVTGCLLLASRETWDALGGFDERFFMYGEDTDLSLRAWNAGYRPRICAESEVVHTIGASSSVPARRRVMIMRGKATVSRLHGGRVGGPLGVALLAGGVGLRAGLGAVKRRVRGTVTDDQEGWMGAWSQRRDWMAGYPPIVGASGDKEFS